MRFAVSLLLLATFPAACGDELPGTSELEQEVVANPFPFDWEMAPRTTVNLTGVYDPNNHRYFDSYINPERRTIYVSPCAFIPLPAQGLDYTFTHATSGWVNSFHAGSCAKIEVGLKRTGRYRVDIRNPQNGATGSTEIKLVNKLVVSLGDSYASGEGGYPYYDETCNKSVSSSHFRAAAAMEAADPKSSVTFLSFACSGAKTFDLFSRSQHEGVPPQIDQLATALCPDGTCPTDPDLRPVIDTMFLSIGGNDAGFANLVTSCIYEALEDYARTGAILFPKLAAFSLLCDMWDVFEQCDEVSELYFAECAPGRLRQDSYYGMATLPRRMSRIAGELEQRFKIDNVHLVGYPTGYMGGNCYDMEMSANDEAWTAQFLADLRTMGLTVAAENAWNFVEVQDIFAGHGYCSSNPYVIKLADSVLTQRDETGTMHPTTVGYTKTGERLYSSVLNAAPVAERDVLITMSGFRLDRVCEVGGCQTTAVGDTSHDVDVSGEVGGVVYTAARMQPNTTRSTVWTKLLRTRRETLRVYAAINGSAENAGTEYTNFWTPDGYEAFTLSNPGTDSLASVSFVLSGADFDPAVLPVGRWTASFRDQDGWAALERFKTIRYGRIKNGLDGVCGRGPDGIYCAYNLGNGAMSAAERWTTSFSDAAGWNAHPSYYETIELVDVTGDGRDDICGRGVGGVMCAPALGSGTAANPDRFGPFMAAGGGSFFSDAAGFKTGGWSHWGTIQYVDLNNDKIMDVCGRAGDGVYCALGQGGLLGSSFGTIKKWSGNFTNGSGWADDLYAGTLQFADITGDKLPELCGRGSTGLICARNLGSSFAVAQVVLATMTDANQWKTASTVATLRFADVTGDGKADACVRANGGALCYASTASATTFAMAPMNGGAVMAPAFSNAAGWNTDLRYSSMRYVDTDGDGLLEVCGRFATGIGCAEWQPGATATSGTFGPVQAITAGMGDQLLPTQPYYGTFDDVKISSAPGAGFCARGYRGIICASR